MGVLIRQDNNTRPAQGFAPNAAGAASRAPDARLLFALEAAKVGYWELGLDGRDLLVSPTFKANWGRKPDEPFTYDIVLRAIHPDDLKAHEDAVRATLQNASQLDVDYRVIWPDGSIHWLRVRGQVIHDAQGKPLRAAGISLDITDRKATEESLREETHTLETLNRIGIALAGNLDLERIVQTATDVATELSGAQFGAFFYNVTNDSGESYTLYTISGVPREAFSKFRMPRNTAVFAPTFAGTGIVRSDDIRTDPRYGKNDPHFGMPKGHLPVVSYLAVPVVSRSGEVMGGLFFGHAKKAVFTERAERLVAGVAAQAATAIDNARLFQAAQYEIAERKRIEEHQRLLLAELNHRVRNTLAIVQSIAGQTLRHASSAENFRTRFEQRIMALSEAHSLLTDSNWEGASVRVIIERVLNPYAAGGEPRYQIATGDDVRVGPNAAVSLLMALHELATNAAKYGALSRTKGRALISWSVEQEPGKMRRLHVRWEETGGPKVKTPTRQGFGSRLIRGLAAESGGEAKLDFAATGLICEFDLPYPADTA